MSPKKNHSQTANQETEEQYSDSSSFLNFELKEHLLALFDSFIEYFQTLFLYTKKIAIERATAGIQAYVFLRIGLFFVSIGLLFFLATFFLFVQRQFQGDPLPATAATGGLCLFISFLFLLLSFSKVRK